ncbi:hypothetical protein OA491_03080 [Alphaproteobacteria bacterium]|nr:hypothetical protein [Alphaproteobacteria bacterium]
MSIFLKLFFFLILNITIYSKVITANELDNAGACAGVVIGNASVDFTLGDQKSFEDGIKIGITAYLSEVVAKKYSKDDIAVADKILASSTDKIINAANAQTFDETVFEEVIKCYRMLANLILKNANTIKTNSMKINNLVIQRTKLLKRILSAG